MPSSATVRPNRLRSPVTSIVAFMGHRPSQSVRAAFPERLYATGGVSTVSAADTVLTPDAWHRWPRSNRHTLGGLATAIGSGLRRGGMAVDVVTDGDEALERLALTRYGVVVLDRDLPGVHGDE